MADRSVEADRPRDPEQPIAWRGVLEDTPVRSSEGEQVGMLADLLGSDQEDIFHGIVVHLARSGREVFIPADDVTLMTPSHIDVAYTSDQLHGLPVHTDERQSELGWVGLFRRRLGWKREEDR
ncbi:MAG: hypothetical protein ACXWMB_07335 [Candidatus Limnocylindria bacterium]